MSNGGGGRGNRLGGKWRLTAEAHGAPAYRGKANAICVHEQQQTVALLASAKNLARYLAGEVPILRVTLSELQRLEPPAGRASLHKDILATVHGEMSLLAALAEKAEAGELSNAQWQNNPQLADLGQRELEIWRQIGAKRCASP